MLDHYRSPQCVQRDALDTLVDSAEIHAARSRKEQWEHKSQPRRALEQEERSNVKIVYLNPTGQLGGAERVLLDLLASLRAAKPDLSTELIVASEGPLAERAGR